jgi:hypothetical protein
MTMVASITDTAQMRTLTEFAADVAQLADQRADLDLRRPDRPPTRRPSDPERG